MRIIYFHQHFSTPDGATGTRSFEMARRLVGRGHQVLMVCGSYSSAATGLTGPFGRGRRRGLVHGIEVIEFSLPYANRDGLLKRTWAFLLFSLRSVGVALREQADLIFATSTPLTAGIPGIAARVLRGIPFVFEIRDLWPELPKAMGVIRNPAVLALMSGLEWSCYHAASRLIALSSGMAEGIERRGIARERIAVISNGCDIDLFAKAQPWRPQSIGAGEFLAIFAGTIGIANGLDAVVEAAAELKRRNRTDIAIAVFGDGKLKRQLMSQASERGLCNLTFHDPVEKTRIAGLLKGADLGLQILADVPAFYRGTSPNKFFDYIAAGLPVLVNYPGWIAELINKGQIGFAVPPRDPVSFADALEQAANDREALRRMGERAQDVAQKQFSRDLLGSSFVAWLEGAAR